MAPDPYKYFRLEARELLDQCGQCVLELERGEDAAPRVQRLLRLAHTLKGAARVVRQAAIADHAHAMEDALSPLRDATGALDRGPIDIVLARLDSIAALLPGLEPDAPPDPVKPAPAKPAPEEAARTVRADLAEMDAVLDGVAETHALVAGLRGAAQGLEQAEHLVELLLAQLAPRRHRGETPERSYAIAEELKRVFAGAGRGLAGSLDQMDRELDQLRDSAERLRLAPVSTLFAQLERSARDTARTLSKEIVFEGQGGDLRLDSHVLGAVQAALIQIMRNAVAHGIEPPDERRRAGKPEAGRIAIAVTRRGPSIAFECRDDGRGLDFEAVRRAALQRGLPQAEILALDSDALIRLLLKGGISTSRIVTGESGRGVGLDVVRETADRLGGDLAIGTERGRFTMLTLTVPSTLAAIEALLVGVGRDSEEQLLAIPLDSVRATLRLGGGDIARVAESSSVAYGEGAIAFMPLTRALGFRAWPATRSWTAIVVAGTGGVAAIGVDRLLGTARIVTRPLPAGLAASAIVAGARLDPEGNPQLVLDPDGLVAAALGGSAGVPDAPPAQKPVLVIDDSLTTRMLEQSILEAAGYQVDTANSAEEGLETARRKPYALFLVDVEMPGMDGFSFVERIRADPGLHHIPAILVTSRAAPEDRQRGREAGAQGYVVKSEFDQSALLSLIRPLMG